MCVNDAQLNYLALELPMGGWKASGLGARHGAGGHPQVQPPAVAAGHALRAARRDLQFFPYKARATKLIARG